MHAQLTLGKYVQEADNLRKKEERKLIAGYSSGRKTLEVGRAKIRVGCVKLG